MRNLIKPVGVVGSVMADGGKHVSGLRAEITDKAVKLWNPDLQSSVSAESDNGISILDPIGEDFWGDGVTAKRISAALRSIGDDGDVVVNINSPGGDFFEGLAIYNLLNEHKGKVTVKILGMAASAASIIAMAADEIQMARASFLMIHNTWVLAAGDQHTFRDVADWLAPFDKAAVDIYGARTGIAKADLSAMLDKETWIGGEDAVAQGFADSLLASDEISSSASNVVSLTPLAAKKKMDIFLSRERVSNSERRKLYAALKGGKLGAALSDTSGAVVHDGVVALHKKINEIQ